MSTDPLAEACCGHALWWHHETRGCGWLGYAHEQRCPCLLTAAAALAAHDAQVRVDERQKVAALLADEGTVEKVAEELSAHDDLPGWTCDDDDRLVYECLCGDRSPALDQDYYIGPDDAETAGAWHRDHVARAALAALAGLIGGTDA